MKCLDLFSGSQSFSKWARKKGWQTWCLDILDIEELHTDFIGDYMLFNPKNHLPYVPDVVWASPDCAAFSIAAGNIHFESKQLQPKTEKAQKSLILVEKLYNDIAFMLELNPNLIFCIENPVGKMRQMEILKPGLFQKIPNFRRVQIDQCAYGRKFKKPTDIFTNQLSFVGKKCIEKSCNHLKGDAFQSTWGITASCHRAKGDNKLSCWKGDGEHRDNSKKTSLKSGYWQRAEIPPALFDDIFCK